MKRIGIVVLSVIAFAACVFSVWLFSHNVLNSIQQNFADEQTLIFSDMVAKSSDALQKTPPDVKSAVGFLEYTHYYYPSGSKQTSGSALDNIVERSRTAAEQQIVDMLNSATGKDSGSVSDWIATDE